MKAAKSLFLLLQTSLYFPACTSSSFSRRRSSFSPRSRLEKKYAHDDILLNFRGGQQPSNGGGAGGVDAASSTPSYHGNYVAQAGERPPAAAAATTTAVQSPPPPAPPVLASATSTSSKMSNLQERTGPALLMLAATFLLLKFTGNNGLIGLVFVMQMAMYSESTSVVEDFSKKGDGAGDDVVSFPLQKWWWFATAMMLTSGRCVQKLITFYRISYLLSFHCNTYTHIYFPCCRQMLTDWTSFDMDQMNLITFGMSAVSLVGAVISLAMIDSSAAEDIYRSYLGKVACCHFSLVSA